MMANTEKSYLLNDFERQLVVECINVRLEQLARARAKQITGSALYNAYNESFIEASRLSQKFGA